MTETVNCPKQELIDLLNDAIKIARWAAIRSKDIGEGCDPAIVLDELKDFRRKVGN